MKQRSALKLLPSNRPNKNAPTGNRPDIPSAGVGVGHGFRKSMLGKSSENQPMLLPAFFDSVTVLLTPALFTSVVSGE